MKRLINYYKRFDQATKLIIAVAVFSLPAYLLFFSSGNFNYMIGMSQLYQFESLYDPTFDGGTNPYGTKIYPYLPNFAIINAVLAFPAYLAISIILERPAPTTGSLANILFVGAGLIVTGLWSYLALIGIPFISKKLFTDTRLSFWSVVIFVSLPVLWIRLFSSSSNSLVALLAMLGILCVKRHQWLLAGLVIGLSMFKFNGLPLGIVLFLYALFGSGVRSSVRVAIGGILSQIPNILYFIAFPDDLFMIIDRGGALTAHAHSLNNRPFLMPIVELGAEDLYITIFPLIVVFFGVLGSLVALKYNGGLPAGFAVGFFATSFLVPGEQRLLTFIILLLLLLLPLWTTDLGKILIGIVISVTTYSAFIPFTRDSSILGLTSAEHAGALGIENGVFLVTFVEYITLPVIFVFALYLLEKKSETLLSSFGIDDPVTDIK